jgi:hypothetical protein
MTVSHAHHDRSGSGPGPERQARLTSLLHLAGDAEARAARIYREMLEESPNLKTGRIEAIGVADLERLFRLYDREFFSGYLAEMLLEDGAHPMAFRLSGRLTRSAGQTMRQTRIEKRSFGRRVTTYEYEIAISTTILFATFHQVDRTITVGGIVCKDRLECLQRIFEHELLHLAEFLGWGVSNCSASNFQTLSRRIFAHEAAVHDMVTPREQARVLYNIQPGDMVSFEMDGVRRTGLVNRITRRATVLVEDPGGRLYTSGNRYLTFYVPLPMLRKLPDG